MEEKMANYTDFEMIKKCAERYHLLARELEELKEYIEHTNEHAKIFLDSDLDYSSNMIAENISNAVHALQNLHEYFEKKYENYSTGTTPFIVPDPTLIV